MKRMCFRNEKDFLQELEGKVYAVSDKNGCYLCDILEDDYLKLLDLGILDDWACCDINVDTNAVLTIEMGEEGHNDFKERFGLLIEIKEKVNPDNLGRISLEYELDSLILKSSEDEIETPFVFMDGVAIQINSLDFCVPVTNPVILVYPRKNEVLNNVRMRDAIEGYRGHSWDGDFYSIALLYGEERKIGHYSGRWADCL